MGVRGSLLVVAPAILLLTACGPSKYSFAELSIDDTAATSNGSDGSAANSGAGSGSGGAGGGAGASGGSSTGGAGASGGSSSGRGGSSGGSSSGAGASSSGGSSSGGAKPPYPGASPSPAPLPCPANTIPIDAKYKCHTKKTGKDMRLHCQFRTEDDDHGECHRHALDREDDDDDLDLRAVAWFVPATLPEASQPECSAVEANSLLARLNNLTSTKKHSCGGFHFRGTVRVCVAKPLPDKKKDRRALLMNAFLDQIASAKGMVTVRNDSARIGHDRISLNIPGPVVAPAYCRRHPSCDRDRRLDPSDWLEKLGLRDHDD